MTSHIYVTNTALSPGDTEVTKKPSGSLNVKGERDTINKPVGPELTVR